MNILDRSKTRFAPGARVRAVFRFHVGCPPGKEVVKRGTLGTVTAEANLCDDAFSGPIRMIPVRWDDGREGEVRDVLLELEAR